jgi:light-independent protochlorophyllide reductase subunit B
VEKLGVRVNVVAPANANPADLGRIPDADFNIVLYPEVALSTASWLEKNFGQKFVNIPPIGVGATRDFISGVAALAGIDPTDFLRGETSRLVWYSRSIDSTYLTAKPVFIFGDATHAIALARVATEELGYQVVGLGTYSREFAREVRAAAKLYGIEALISDDYLEVEDAIKAANPALVLGTQMERHIAKRLGIPCAVISAPVHVQDFPARYSPFMGFEGANVLFDTLTHPLMMGLEEHLLGMFREDFEFSADAAASHLGAAAPLPEPEVVAATAAWDAEAEKELRKIPFFVRGKAKRNTEAFAAMNKLPVIKLDTLYDAKAYYS